MMMKFSKTLPLLILLCGSAGSAQLGLIPGTSDPSKADLRVMTENHSLVSTTITPMELSAEGYVVGFDEGTMDVDTLKDFISQFREQKRRAHLDIQPAVETHSELVVTPKLDNMNSKKKKIKKQRDKPDFQASTEIQTH